MRWHVTVNCGGAPDHHYYGTHTWYDPGAFNSASPFLPLMSVLI